MRMGNGNEIRVRGRMTVYCSEGGAVRSEDRAKFEAWVAALERRHLADLRVQEITRALRALSAAYVERRERGPSQHVRGALETAGKRAAFALYYAPLHFLTVTEIVAALGAQRPAPASIVDVGCGTGAAGAAWALAAGSTPKILGIDRHPWAASETRWTLSQFALAGTARRADITRQHVPAPPGAGAIAAYTLNELPDRARQAVEDRLIAMAERGGRVLIIEPVAGGVAPWWPDTVRRIAALGGRSDDWRIALDAPPIVRLLGKAAGLD